MIYLESDAVISDCTKYCYLLRRTWDYDKPRVLIVMLNPSKADANIDDNTIKSLVRICQALDFGSFEVVNLFGWRATDPKELLEIDNPIGPATDNIIQAAVYRCDIIVCAWGAFEMAENRGKQVREMLRHARPAVFCFGITKSGAPKHMLYIKAGTKLQRYGT